MDNNDILRRLRYAFDFDDNKMMALFKMGGIDATRAQTSDWLKKDVDPAYVALKDFQLAVFLNGMIIDRRGKKEGPQPVPEKRLNNNLVLRKLKIALNLKDEDIVQYLDSVGFKVRKPELSAFFRKPSDQRFRSCKDQILRNFLKSLEGKYRKAGRMAEEGTKAKAEAKAKTEAKVVVKKRRRIGKGEGGGEGKGKGEGKGEGGGETTT